MEKAVEVLFNDQVMDEFLSRFGLEKRYKKLGDFENYVFKVYRNDHPFILRITHSTHRSSRDLESEIDWINYLHRKNVSCPQCFPSIRGSLVEGYRAKDGSFFYCSLFEEAQGKPIKVQSNEFNQELFHAWGKAVGKIHAATKNYKPNIEIHSRQSWYEEDLLQFEKYVPVGDEIVIQNAQELVGQLKELPRTRENYGLIHTDVHSGNFFYDGKEVNIFDFDDCCYHWFASDIAIPLYYSILYGWLDKNEADRGCFAEEFIKHFTRGYIEVNNLPEHWKEQTVLFLKFRDIVLYTVLHKKIAPEDRNKRIEEMLRGMRERIISKTPIVNIV